MKSEPIADFPHTILLSAAQGLDRIERQGGQRWVNYVPFSDFSCKPEIIAWLGETMPRGGYRRRKIRVPPDFGPGLEVRFKALQHAVFFKLRWF